MNDPNGILRQLHRLGIALADRDTELVVGLATSWLATAERVRSATEEIINPAVGPITAGTHRPGR